MSQLAKRILRYGIGFVLGGTVGFLYYYFVGCASGTCAITSNPYISIIWGGVFGALVASFFDPKKSSDQPTEHKE